MNSKEYQQLKKEVLESYKNFMKGFYLMHRDINNNELRLMIAKIINDHVFKRTLSVIKVRRKTKNIKKLILLQEKRILREKHNIELKAIEGSF